MSKISNPNILARIAECEKIQAKSREIQQRAARLQELVAARGEAEREVQAVDASDAAAMSKWVAEGCVGDAPSPDVKARDLAVKKLTTATARAAAAESSLRELYEESLRLSAQLEQVNLGVDMEVATHLTELHAGVMQQARALEDQRDVKLEVAAAIWREAQRRHPAIAGRAAKDAEKARVEWIQRRGTEIDEAIRAAWLEIAGTFQAQ